MVSPSSSNSELLQPDASTLAPAGVDGHSSIPFLIPSESESGAFRVPTLIEFSY